MTGGSPRSRRASRRARGGTDGDGFDGGDARPCAETTGRWRGDRASGDALIEGELQGVEADVGDSTGRRWNGCGCAYGGQRRRRARWTRVRETGKGREGDERSRGLCGDGVASPGASGQRWEAGGGAARVRARRPHALVLLAQGGGRLAWPDGPAGLHR